MFTHVSRYRAIGAATIVAAFAAACSPVAFAGGSPENLLLIVDPADPDSLHVANYYVNARQIPANNVLYMYPGASDYPTFAENNLDAFFGYLTNAGTADHVDYVVLMPGAPFYVYAPDLVSDQCYPVSRFATPSCYTLAFQAEDILTGTLSSNKVNRFFPVTFDHHGFDSEIAWYRGNPSDSSVAEQYFIGATLGYAGNNGNTIAETLDMIDRSVAADGSRPDGTFYFMDNTADPLRNVRADFYPGVVSAITDIGGQAEILSGALPTGEDDCLGVVTGDDHLNIPGDSFTLIPGAFADHLTSYAARFDTDSQTKVSAWIQQGASGSWGAVEEPCNYTGKFPNPRLHRFYLEGASLGEAAFRSALYYPFQMLLYGDPMTRPFAHLPTVTVPDAPTAPVSGTITLTPNATTTHPTADIAQLDLLVDGLLFASILPGEAFTVDTTLLSDGWHDLRVLAFDDTDVKSAGRWLGELVVDNTGRSTTLDPLPLAGDLATAFVCDIGTSTEAPIETRLIHNGRVVAASTSGSPTLTVYGRTLGAGPASLQAEALYLDGSRVRSAPVQLELSTDDGTPSGLPPMAFDYTKFVLPEHPIVVELPATYDGIDQLTFTLLTEPAQATVAPDQSGAYRLIRPVPDASGTDTFTFEVGSAAGTSNVAEVTLVYGDSLWITGDTDCNGTVDFDDIQPFVKALSGQAEYESAYPDCRWLNADADLDGDVDFDDIAPFVSLIGG